VLIAPCRRCDGYQLLYHLEALQLSFFSFSPPFFSTLSNGYVTGSEKNNRVVIGGEEGSVQNTRSREDEGENLSLTDSSASGRTRLPDDPTRSSATLPIGICFVI